MTTLIIKWKSEFQFPFFYVFPVVHFCFLVYLGPKLDAFRIGVSESLYKGTIALTFGLTLPYLHHTFIPEKNVKWFKLCIVLFPALPFSSLLFYFYGGWELSFGPVIRNSCLTVTAYPQIRGAHVVRHPLHIDIASA